ncbi:MAG: Integrase [Jatrophihabitans sp.]|nr:Integrase [Jatrophihabitans sp.]
MSRGWGEGSVDRKGTGWEASAYIEGRHARCAGPAIQVRGSLQRIHGDLQILEPKTAQSYATSRSAASVRAHRARQAEERLALGTSWTDRGLVFPNRWGDYMNPEWFASASSAICSVQRGCARSASTTYAHLRDAATGQQPARQDRQRDDGPHPDGNHPGPLHPRVRTMQRAAADALDLVVEPRPRTKPEECEASMPGQGVLPLVP